MQIYTIQMKGSNFAAKKLTCLEKEAAQNG